MSDKNQIYCHTEGQQKVNYCSSLVFVFKLFWLFEIFEIFLRDRLQISLLRLNEFKRINQVLFPMKSSAYDFLMISVGIEIN